MWSATGNKFRNAIFKNGQIRVYKRKQPASPADYQRLAQAEERRHRRGLQRNPDIA